MNYFFKQKKTENDNKFESEEDEPLKKPSSLVRNLLLEHIEENMTNKIKDLQKGIENFSFINVNLKYVFFFFILGVLMVIVGISFLPLFLLFPEKFCFFFSFGCLFILISFVLFKGIKEFFKLFFSKEKIIFSMCYIVSLFFNVYFALFDQKYLFVFISSLIQVQFYYNS